MRAFALCLLAGVAAAQVRLSQTTRLPVYSSGLAAASWTAEPALLEENFQHTAGWLTVRNVSGRLTSGARFYADYLDREDRPCFSLAFSSTKPFAPGEQRTLFAFTQLAPAVEPASVRLYAVRDDWTLDGAAGAAFRAPVTVREGVGNGWEGLAAAPGVEFGNGAASLALARVTVDADGRAAGIEVIRAAMPEHASWARGFLRNLRFAAATRDGSPVGEDTLVLIRIADFTHGVTKPFPARDDPWMKAYVKGHAAAPVVNQLRFERQSFFGAAEGAGTQWRYASWGTDWCLESFHWIPDPAARGTKRAWNRPDDAAQLTLR